MDGIEAASHIRRTLDIPVIFLTGYVEQDVIDRAKLTEPYGYLSKPCSFQELRSTIEIALYKHKADKRLRESEQKYRGLVEQSIDGVVVAKGTTLLFVNPATVEMLGYENEKQLVGRNFLEFVAPEFRETMQKRGLDREKGKAVPESYEFIALRKDGSSFPAEIRASLTLFEGEAARQGIVRDITERKKAEQALKEQTALLESLINAIPDNIYFKDLNRQYLLVNKAFEAFFQIERGEVLGKTMEEFGTLSGIEQSRESDERVMATKTFFNREHFWPDKHGKTRILETRKFPILNSDEQLIAIGGISRDISEQRQLAGILHHQKVELQTIFDSVPAWVFYKDAENHILNANMTYLESLGLSFRDIVGRSLEEFLPSEQAKEFHRDDMEVMQSGQAKRGIVQQIQVRKTPRWLTIDKVPYRDQNGVIVGVIVFAQDITDRKKAEEALRDSELKYRTLVENLDVGVFITTLDGVFLYTNPAMARIAGYDSVEELMTVPAHKLHVSESSRQNFIKELFDKGRVKGIERFGRRKDGTLRWVSLNSVLQKDRSGSILNILSVVEDVDDRKQMADALEKSLERFRLAMDATNDGVWDWDVSTDETYYSPGYFLMLGFEPAKYPTHFTSWLDLVHTEDQKHACELRQDCVSGKLESFEAEFRMRHNDGSWRWILGRAKSVTRNTKGRSERLCGTFTDITDRKKSEQAIGESEERYRMLLETMNEAFGVQDGSGKVTYVNDKMCELWGYSREELIGTSIEDFLDEENRTIVRNQMASRKEGGTSNSYEIVWTVKGGRKLPTLVSPRPLYDSTGNFAGSFAVITDLTNQKETEAQLKKSSS